MRTRTLIAILVVALAFGTRLPAQDAKPTAGKQVEQVFVTSDSIDVPYLIYLPKDYSPQQSKWPLMLFLHGRGESDGPLQVVTRWGPPKLIAQGVELPYIVVSPQCPKDDFWSKPSQQSRLVELLDWVVDNYSVDKNRVYLTGLSMGGYGSWRMAADHPDRFAAVVPICGAGDPKHAERLKSLPIWVFHGDQDRVVPFQRSVDMVEAIKTAGSKTIRFTTLEHVGHNSWSAAYGSPELYQWLNEQGRAEK